MDDVDAGAGELGAADVEVVDAGVVSAFLVEDSPDVVPLAADSPLRESVR